MFEPGQIINDTYEILDMIGSGGGGIIYKAVHLRMRKNVAIKLIKDNVKGLVQNRAEVDLLKDLKNPYLPQVIDFVECDSQVYTVMEFIEGQNFKQIISSGKYFTEKEVIEFGKQLCSAVSYLHSHTPPIIHSDIKPANIMLTPERKICLIDFNISTVASGSGAFSIGCSQGFSAPEQYKKSISMPLNEDGFHEETRFYDDDSTELLIENEKPVTQTKNVRMAYVDTKTDIYGIGASLYYILTGRAPQNGKVDFRGIRISSKLKNIINKAMSPEPEKRFRSADEMKAALNFPGIKYAVIGSAIAVCAAVGIVAAVNMSGKNNSDNKITASETLYAAADESQTEIQTETAAETQPHTQTETQTTTAADYSDEVWEEETFGVIENDNPPDDSIAWEWNIPVTLRDGKFVASINSKYHNILFSLWFQDDDDILCLGEVSDLFGYDKGDDLQKATNGSNIDVTLDFNNKWLALDGYLVPAYSVWYDTNDNAESDVLYRVPCYINENYDNKYWINVGRDFLSDELVILGMYDEYGHWFDSSKVNKMEFSMDGTLTNPKNEIINYYYTYNDFNFSMDTTVTFEEMSNYDVYYYVIFEDDDGNMLYSDIISRSIW